MATSREIRYYMKKHNCSKSEAEAHFAAGMFTGETIGQEPHWGDNIRKLQFKKHTRLAQNVVPDVGMTMKRMKINEITLNEEVPMIARAPSRVIPGHGIEFHFEVETEGCELIGSFLVEDEKVADFLDYVAEYTTLNLTLRLPENPQIQQNATLKEDKFIVLDLVEWHADRSNKAVMFMPMDGGMGQWDVAVSKNYADDLKNTYF